MSHTEHMHMPPLVPLVPQHLNIYHTGDTPCCVSLGAEMTSQEGRPRPREHIPHLYSSRGSAAPSQSIHQRQKPQSSGDSGGCNKTEEVVWAAARWASIENQDVHGTAWAVTVKAGPFSSVPFCKAPTGSLPSISMSSAQFL